MKHTSCYFISVTNLQWFTWHFLSLFYSPFSLAVLEQPLPGAQHAPLCISSPVTSDGLNPDGRMRSVALPSCALLLKVYVHLHFTCITCICRGYSLLLLLCKKSASKLSSEPRHLPLKMHSISFHRHC